MKLIVQPDAGVAPIVNAIKQAKKTVDVQILRLDREEIMRALEAAVARGVAVRALIAHTNRGGEKSLRKLELRLLEAGHSRHGSRQSAVDSRQSAVGSRQSAVDSPEWTVANCQSRLMTAD